MLDFGFLTLPAMAAAMVFMSALFVGGDVVLEKINVPKAQETVGFTSSIVTRRLADDLRTLSYAGASELSALRIDEGGVEKGINAFEDYFEVGLLINGARNILGMIKYYVNGEIVSNDNKLALTIRVYAKDKHEPVRLLHIGGDTDKIDDILHQGAIQTLEYINPYVVTLYYRRMELAARDYDFPKTHESVRRFLATQPLEKHFLAYGLLGRMHMLKAELDTALTPEQQETQYREAIRHLNAALLQEPDFLYPLINLGIIYAGKKEYALADDYFARAVKIHPNYLITRKAWGKMLVEQGQIEDAIVQYVAAVQIAPEDPSLRYILARLYEQVGMQAAARTQFEEALMINPISREYAAALKALEVEKEGVK
ncbi:tetratricopeptide repeat protein [Aquabacter sp. CN5-332]|uniref:tetratricopeptide repeat protein n=1 Tax=Aquabacter sp. CN5-332 TaxID=3156608 RepID=UPI0032B3B204